jgi:hypothetical protein
MQRHFGPLGVGFVLMFCFVPKFFVAADINPLLFIRERVVQRDGYNVPLRDGDLFSRFPRLW